MQPKAHLFVVDNDTLPLHIQKGFCGIIKTIENSGAHLGQIADLMNIRVGDLIFFYMMKKSRTFFRVPNSYDELQQGYYGVFKVTGLPFADSSEIQGDPPLENYYIFGSEDNPNHNRFNIESFNSRTRRTVTAKPPILYYRILIKPVANFEQDFQKRFVDDNQAYIDKTDEGNLWTLFFKKIKRPGEARSITPILPEEASKIARLIFKQRENEKFPLAYSDVPYDSNNRNIRKIEMILEIGSNPEELSSESMLEAYILYALNNDLDIGILSEIIGNSDEIEFSGNQVQYGISGNKVDLLILHRKNLAGNTGYRHKSTVIELKKGRLTKDNVNQIIDYQKWIAQLTTYNDLKAIQPILIGKKPSSNMRQGTKDEIKNSLKEIKMLGISKPRFLEYIIKADGDEIKDIIFEEFDINQFL